MRRMLAAFGAMAFAATAGAPQPDKPVGVSLADLTWQEAESSLTPSTVVVIPLGAASVEQGPHLKLNAGERLARHLASRVQEVAPVLIAPPLTYHFFPAYVEYPGSTSLSQTAARDLTVDIVRSIARHGPRRFYVLNTGAAAMRALADAATVLADSGVLLGWTDLRYQLANARITRQQRTVDGVPHADELETSMMLAIDPSSVEMKKAIAEYGKGTGVLTRKDDGRGIISKTGVLGDPTVATAQKGRALIDAAVTGILADIENLRSAPLPPIKTPASPGPARATSAAPPAERRLPDGCTPNDERTIRQVGTRFSLLWHEMDALKISQLFSAEADMRHPDGTIERTPEVIRQNRELLFAKKEYRGSEHPVTVYDVRCLSPNYAVADGKWELRFADFSRNAAQPDAAPPIYSGLFTLVLSNANGSEWSIEAWRYTVTPDQGPPPPTILKQPGFIGRGSPG